jgi:hypothetical protein
LHLAPIVVNGLYPRMELDFDPVEAAERAGVAITLAEADALARAANFRLERQQLQDEQVRRLADALPLPQLHLPFLFTTELGPTEVDHLAGSLAEEIRRLPDVTFGAARSARGPAGVRAAGQ